MKERLSYQQIIVYAVIYFFFNSLLLPHGLLYTTLLTPLMLYFLFKHGKLKQTFLWGILFLIPIPFQILGHVDIKSFAVSTTMILSVFFLLMTTLLIVRNNEEVFERVFRKVLLINGILVLLAILIYPVTSIRWILWYDEILTRGLELIPRLKLFTYEASYYSLIMMPVFLYFILTILMGNEKHSMIVSITIGVSIILSLSFGVIGALIIALIISLIFTWKYAPPFMRRFILLGSITFLIIITLMVFIWPENPIYYRVENIFKGEDTSAMGRLVYSFMFAKDIILTHNPLFGIGPGQIKIIAHDMIVSHYEYYGDLAEIVRIPNSMAEMLATYGLFGFIIKLMVEIYFFFRYKLYNNMYSLVLFLFIFIYQFTGSFITNAAEVVIWAMVFGLRFSEFEINRKESSEIV